MSLRILNAEPHHYSKRAHQILSEIGTVTDKPLTQEQLADEIQYFDVLVVRLGLRVTSEIINRGEKLKFILSATTGLDHIDLECARNKNVKVISLKGEYAFLDSIPSTAEYTWALLLALMRNLPSAVNSVQQGNWDRDQFKGNNLSGKRLGIIGLGRVGKQVAHFAKAFKCEVGSYDPYQNRGLDFVQQFSSLKELVRWAEIVTLHIPYSTETHHFIGKELLSSFNKGSILINTSRGGVWDESEVSALVKNGYLAGVATDVLEFELDDTKRPSSPLLKLMASNQNVLITPHIAGATFESMELTEIFIAQKLKTAISVS